MKEHPILMSAPMVLATLADLKTQTRRVPTSHNSVWGAGDWKHHGHDFDKAWADKGFAAGDGVYRCGYLHVPFWHLAEGREKWAGAADRLYCRYEVGDRLWVKETFSPGTLALERKEADNVCYRAGKCPCGDEGRYHTHATTWRPSIFMPRWASRITLEIVSVRAERLQDITEEDAEAEGVYAVQSTEPGLERVPYYRSLQPPKELFRMLWDFINSDRAPWKSNPWVWRIEFRRIS